MTEREIFIAALAIADPVERDAFLSASCSDPTQKQHVMALLEMERSLGSFLESPATAFDAESGRAGVFEGPGSVIGPYRLVETIGEGGMGIVFRAEQAQPVRREVALKIIKPGMDSRQVIARFEAERQALALMDHPNIARVFDAGTSDSGRPFFVMELVRGEPITEFCDRLRLDAERRLGLFNTVCHAIQHAHHKGIIHRDIKPSNVLVTTEGGEPAVKVIDFGVAKATAQKLTEKTFFTGFGQMIGTPAYMSPEQADLGAADVDTRTDIFSLGVLLYELLTGTTPIVLERLRAAGLEEVLRVIREEEPPRPSTRVSSLGETATLLAGNRGTDPGRLARLLAGDLEWILMKSLAKDRNRRYESPGSLAEDVNRYLRREAILARPPSAAYRLARFARRRRGLVLTVGAVTLALVLGTAVALWQAITAMKARHEMEIAFEAARAREAETRSVLQFVQDRVFAAARPEGQAGGLGSEVTLRRALKSALTHLDRGFRGRPLIEARLRNTLGNSFLYLGEADVAATQQLSARALFSDQLGPDDPDTLQSVNDLAGSYRALGRYPEALALYEDTLARRKAVLGADDIKTLESMNNLANILDDLGRRDEALKLREETLEKRRETLGPDHADTIGSMRNLANSYAAFGRGTEALALEEKALPLATVTLGPTHPDTLAIRNNLALSYAHARRFEDALKLQDETVALLRSQLSEDHPTTLVGLLNRAKLLSDLKRYDEAVEQRKQVLMFQTIKPGPDHPNTLHTMYGLANDVGFLGRYEEALEWHTKALEGRKAKLGPDHVDTLYSMWGVAVNLVRLDRGADAVPIIDECLARATAQPVPIRNAFSGLVKHRLAYFRGLGDAEGCRTTAELWEKLGADGPDAFVEAARYRAVAASVLLSQHQAAGTRQQADAEIGRALAWLRRAIDAGFKDKEALARSADFEALKDHPEFRELLANLEGKPQ